MAVRSRRVNNTVAVGTGATAVYTVPAGRTLIVRNALFVNQSGAAITCAIIVNGNFIWRSGVAPDSTTGPPFMVFNPGDVITVTKTGANPCYFTMFGTLLWGEPT